MKNISLFTIISLFIISLMSGCNAEEGLNGYPDEENKENEESGRVLLPSKIITYSSTLFSPSRISFVALEYDSQNRIICIEYVYNGEKYKTVKVSYENDDINTEELLQSDPEYKVVKVYRRDGMQVLINGKEDIGIDNNLQAVHVEQDMYGPCNFTYDDNGNAISYTYHAWSDERTRTVNFTYNNDNGIFRNVKVPSWFLTTQLYNFVVSEENKITYQSLYNNCATSSENGYDLYKYEYTYSEDYPIKINEIPVGVVSNSSMSFEVEYIDAN